MISKVYVIAEAGSCHDTKWKRAVELIECAKGAGADAVKFQYWSNAAHLADRRRTKADLYETYALPTEWLAPLAQLCKQAEIEFMCTAYLPEDIAAVIPFVSKFKVSSFEALDTRFVDAHPKDRDLLISLGMIAGIEMPHLLERRRANPRIQYLHCVSGYPTPVAEVNLAVLRHYMLDGFSDHTADVHMGADATLAGARIIEAHIRASETPSTNPDYPHALAPYDFHRYVNNIRAAETRLGNPVKCVQPSERENLAFQVFSS